MGLVLHPPYNAHHAIHDMSLLEMFSHVTIEHDSVITIEMDIYDLLANYTVCNPKPGALRKHYTSTSDHFYRRNCQITRQYLPRN